MELFLTILGALVAYRLIAPLLDRVAFAVWGNPLSAKRQSATGGCRPNSAAKQAAG